MITRSKLVTIGIIAALLAGVGWVIASRSSELSLSDYPGLFELEAMIIVGDNASQVELDSAVVVSEDLTELTGNSIVVKKSSEATTHDELDHNLIIIGTLQSNSLVSEVYETGEASDFRQDNLGPATGILEMLYNPWNKDKALLLVTGCSHQGLIYGLGELYYLTAAAIQLGNSTGTPGVVTGTLREQVSSWTPRFNDCTSACYSVETEGGDVYYLANVCPYTSLLSGQSLSNSRILVGAPSSLSYLDKQVEIEGKLEIRGIAVPSRTEETEPEVIEDFHVLVIAKLKTLSDQNEQRRNE